MADTKFSALTAVASVASANEFPINEAGTSKKVTAAQIKTFVTTAPVFVAGTSAANTAPKLTSGTLNSTAEAGALEYDGTAFYATPNTTAGRAVMPGMFLYRTTADATAGIGSAIADFFPATSSFATVANAIYSINYWLFFSKTTSNTVRFTLTNTQSYTNINAFERNSIASGITAVGTVRGMGIEGITAAAALLPNGISLASGLVHHAHIHAIAECSAAGNIRLRVQSGSGSVTPQSGSFYTVEQLPAAATVGIAVA